MANRFADAALGEWAYKRSARNTAFGSKNARSECSTAFLKSASPSLEQPDFEERVGSLVLLPFVAWLSDPPHLEQSVGGAAPGGILATEGAAQAAIEDGELTREYKPITKKRKIAQVKHTDLNSENSDVKNWASVTQVLMW